MKKQPAPKPETEKINPKTLKGTVVSNKMTKTIVVRVGRYVMHPKYKKYYKISKKYKADTGEKTFNIGDMVTIVECRPISKDKHFKVI